MGITKETLDKIKAMFDMGCSYVEIAKKMNISEKVIKHICQH